MEDIRIITGAGIPLVALALYIMARLANLGSRMGSILAVVLALEVVIWMPAGVRDWTLAVIVAMAVFASWDGEPGGGFVAGLVSGAIVLALGMLPGGNTALILSGLAIAGFFRIRGSSQHLARWRRTAALEPGELPPGDVMIGGTVHESEPMAVPLGHEIANAVWWAVCLDGETRATSGMVRVDSEAGTVLADLTHVQLEFTSQRSLFNQVGDPAAIDRLFVGHEFVARGKDPSARAGTSDERRFDQRVHYSLHWLEASDPVVLMGTPTWERAPADMAGYRDAPLVPMFRGNDGFAADKSVARARNDAFFSLLAWSAWTPVCAAVGVLQLVGLL